MKSFTKVIQVLNCISYSDIGLRITEISSKLSIPISTVHRILNTLSHYSLVYKEKETLRYRLGVQILKYANSFYRSLDLSRDSKQSMEEISIHTGLTVFLSIWQDAKVICIDSVKSSQNTNTYSLFVELGKTMPFHCAASAKIILAYQSSDIISTILNQSALQKYTSKTIVNSKELIEQLKIIKSQNFAVCDEELEEGIRAISAPIKNDNDKTIASITVTGLVNKIPKEKDKHFAKIVIEAANDISHKIGYREISNYN